MTQTTDIEFTLSASTISKTVKAANDWRAAEATFDNAFLPMADAVFGARETIRKENESTKSAKEAWKYLRGQLSLKDAEVSNAIRSGMVAHILDIQKVKLGKKNWRGVAGHNGASLSTLMSKCGLVTTGKVDGRTDGKVHAMSTDGQDAIVEGIQRWYDESADMTRAALDAAFRDESEEPKEAKTTDEKWTKNCAENVKLAENEELSIDALDAHIKTLMRVKIRRQS